MKSLSIDILILLVLLGIFPVITLLLQFALVGLHGLSNHYSQCEAYLPRVAVIVPVWNEGDVIADSLDRLMLMEYPPDRYRVYVVDDASDDDTPLIIAYKATQYPQNIFHLRREKGGLGKAYVLNHGLSTILADSWAEAVLIMDADVLFRNDTLRKMTRHLADTRVGAVTAYIREGQLHGNMLSRFVAFEYVVAQAASRRAQNVMGVLACLAGGAQLLTRSNLTAIGGLIDTSTLAEDTFTTFKTQLQNNRVIFDGNALASSEEPGNIYALWKQRFRWARGNIQITKAFRHLWFHPSDPSRLGGIFFGLVWFSTLLMPFIMILTSCALVILFFLDPELSWDFFRLYAIAGTVSYLFTTLYAFLIDPKIAKRAYYAGILFPGLISLVMMIIAVFPHTFEYFLRSLTTTDFIFWRNNILLFMDAWISVCMLFAYLLYRIDRMGFPPIVTNFLLLFVGYGPLLCVITLSAFVAEKRKKVIKWDKTEKTGKLKGTLELYTTTLNFEDDLIKDMRIEYRLFWCELIVIAIITVVLFLRWFYTL